MRKRNRMGLIWIFFWFHTLFEKVWHSPTSRFHQTVSLFGPEFSTHGSENIQFTFIEHFNFISFFHFPSHHLLFEKISFWMQRFSWMWVFTFPGHFPLLLMHMVYIHTYYSCIHYVFWWDNLMFNGCEMRWV